MVLIIASLLLIAAALADLLSRIGFLEVPVEYEFWPGLTVLFIGSVILVNGVAKVASRFSRKVVVAPKNTQAAYDSEINRILEEQRNMSEKKNNTAETGQVVYDEDAI